MSPEELVVEREACRLGRPLTYGEERVVVELYKLEKRKDVERKRVSQILRQHDEEERRLFLEREACYARCEQRFASGLPEDPTDVVPRHASFAFSEVKDQKHARLLWLGFSEVQSKFFLWRCSLLIWFRKVGS
jgi:hypothetical protein